MVGKDLAIFGMLTAYSSMEMGKSIFFTRTLTFMILQLGKTCYYLLIASGHHKIRGSSSSFEAYIDSSSGRTINLGTQGEKDYMGPPKVGNLSKITKMLHYICGTQNYMYLTGFRWNRWTT